MKNRSIRIPAGSLMPVFLVSLITSILLLTPGCKEPMSAQQLREKNIEEDLALHPAREVKFTAAVTLNQAIAFAEKFNLDTALMERKQEIKKELARQSWLKLLPSLKGNWEQSDRSQYSASSSVNLETGAQALSSSYSSEKRSTTHNISLMWNALDFGLSYLSARQAEKRTAIAEQQLKRARQDLRHKVTQAYWDCVLAQTAEGEAKQLISMLEARDEKLVKRMQEKMIPKRDGLNSRKDLLSLLMQLRNFEHTAEKARAELARLMGLSPETNLRVANVTINTISEFETFDVEALGQEALDNRPELYQEDLEEKISQDNVKMAILKMFPSPNLSLRHDWDDNPYIEANYWYTTSASVGWDMLSIPQHISAKRSSAAMTELIRQRRMAMAIGILSQLHLSVIQYHDFVERCKSSAKLKEVNQELLTVAKRMVKRGASNNTELTTAEIESFFANVRYMENYVNLKKARSQIDNTIGSYPELKVGSLPYRLGDPEKIKEEKEKLEPLKKTYGVDGTYYKSMPKVVKKRADTEKS